MRRIRNCRCSVNATRHHSPQPPRQGNQALFDGRLGYSALAIPGGSFAAVAIGAVWFIERIAQVSPLAL
jgi:hypothetical protein